MPGAASRAGRRRRLLDSSPFATPVRPPSTPFWQIEVEVRPGLADPDAAGARAALEEAGTRVRAITARRGFLLHGSIPRPDAERAAAELLADPVSDRYRIRRTDEAPFARDAARRRIDVLRKPGVMDPVAGSVQQALRTLAIEVPAVATFRSFEVECALDAGDLRTAAGQVLANETIETLVIDEELPLPAEPAKAPFVRVVVPLRALEGEALDALSARMSLSLTRLEMERVRDHFRGQDRDPTDAEIETIAQTWSEHCKHKTLKGACDYSENGAPPRRIGSILGETIFRATEATRREWCLSVFVDNAGVIDFDGENALCFKVETHNHPSAIEPYGGAGTGIGGVIRDVLGTGTGARPVASTDVFCVGPLDLPVERLPKGTLAPRRVLRGVVAGVRDYGNRMGIPTVSGGVFVDPGYTANPLVFCGTVGLLPRSRVTKEVRPGDAIVLIGGRTGRDGIHGATFSSVELHEESQVVSATAVQIGDPITEKKAVESILRAAEEGLVRSVTDCGAGGLSSAIGELAEPCGAEVELDRVPLKYAGLRYDEIWISEAQERMVLAVAPENVDRVRAICAEEEVDCTVLGSFVDSGRLRLRFAGETVGDLDLEFLHGGVPRVVRRAEWSAPVLEEPTPPKEGALGEILLAILRSPNVASKEWIVRQYDHEVQGTSVVKPFCGPRRDGPMDAAVIAPIYGSRRGFALSAGLNPRYGAVDPASLAEAAIDEALRNVVAAGGDPERTAILDNYCWGNCDRPDRLGALVRASEAARDLAIAYGTPFISGKDSLNNEYRVGGESIPIPPTFLVSALSIVEDVGRAVTMDLKRRGSRLVLVGLTRDELGGSHLHLVRGVGPGPRAPRVDPAHGRAVLRGVAAAIRAGLVLSCHDLSEGGLAVAAAEMSFAGGLGVALDASLVPLAPGTPDRLDLRLFSESCSRFLLEVEAAALPRLAEILGAVPHADIGWSTGDGRFRVLRSAEPVFSVPVEDLRTAFLSGYHEGPATAGSGGAR